MEICWIKNQTKIETIKLVLNKNIVYLKQISTQWKAFGAQRRAFQKNEPIIQIIHLIEV